MCSLRLINDGISWKQTKMVFVDNAECGNIMGLTAISNTSECDDAAQKLSPIGFQRSDTEQEEDGMCRGKRVVQPDGLILSNGSVCKINRNEPGTRNGYCTIRTHYCNKPSFKCKAHNQDLHERSVTSLMHECKFMCASAVDAWDRLGFARTYLTLSWLRRP